MHGRRNVRAVWLLSEQVAGYGISPCAAAAANVPVLTTVTLSLQPFRVAQGTKNGRLLVDLYYVLEREGATLSPLRDAASII